MSRRERKKEETRVNITNCAVSLFKEKGFDETSMEEIAETSDVSKGTLYNYFQDKESILVAYFQGIIAEYGHEVKAHLADNMEIQQNLYKLLDLVSKLFKTDKEMAIVYLKYRMQEPNDINLIDNSKRSGIENLVLEIIEKAQGEGQLRSDIPALVLTRSFQLLAKSFLLSSLYTKESVEIDRIKIQLIDLFLNGAKQ